MPPSARLRRLRTPAQSDPRALMLGFEVARALETATDHLAHAALSLRDLVLEDLRHEHGL